MSTWHRVAPSIYRHGPTGALYERSVIKGKRTFKKLASHKVADARDELNEERSRRNRIEKGLEKAPDDKTEWPVSFVLRKYLDADCPDRNLHKRPRLSESEEKRRIGVLLRFFKTHRVRDLTPEVCTDYGLWRMDKKNVREGFDGRRSADAEMQTLANALDFSHISKEPLRNRKKLYRPSTALKCRDCAPQSGDELHGIVQILFSGNFKSQSLGWQALFEAFTGIRTSEALGLRMDAKERGEAGFIEQKKWLWLHRSKHGVNPWVNIENRPELQELIRAHSKWHARWYPDSPWYFPSSDDPQKAVGKDSLHHALRNLFESNQIERKVTSHGMRAFYVLVRRSDGIADGQIAAEIGDRTASLIETTYGGLPPKWKGGPEIGFMPTKGKPAWHFLKEPTKTLKHLRAAA